MKDIHSNTFFSKNFLSSTLAPLKSLAVPPTATDPTAIRSVKQEILHSDKRNQFIWGNLKFIAFPSNFKNS